MPSPAAVVAAVAVLLVVLISLVAFMLQRRKTEPVQPLGPLAPLPQEPVYPLKPPATAHGAQPSHLLAQRLLAAGQMDAARAVMAANGMVAPGMAQPAAGFAAASPPRVEHIMGVPLAQPVPAAAALVAPPSPGLALGVRGPVRLQPLPYPYNSLPQLPHYYLQSQLMKLNYPFAGAFAPGPAAAPASPPHLMQQPHLRLAQQPGSPTPATAGALPYPPPALPPYAPPNVHRPPAAGPAMLQ